jgi:hypothetical protein
MTEQRWRNSTSVPEVLGLAVRKGASMRKLRLFACGCCRQRVWHLLSDRRSRAAVETSERYAEGESDAASLRAAWTAARAVRGGPGIAPRSAAIAAAHTPHPHHTKVPRGAAGNVFTTVYYRTGPDRDAVRDAERAAHLALARCVFGNPFCPVRLDLAWLAWDGGTVPKLAQVLYDERSLPDGALDGRRLAVLADALEDAGCTDAEVLNHLRSPEPHVRGCWVVDLLLGKT